MPKKSSAIFLAAAILCAALWTSCAAAKSGLSAWVVDWELADSLKEAAECKGHLSSVQLFGASFNPSGRLFLNPALQAWLPKAAAWKRDMGAELWLTVANDRIAKGSAVYKDPQLVARLVADEDYRKSHVAQLLRFASQEVFDGIELDYENVRPEDWGGYLSFCGELARVLDFVGKKLRVILEPKPEYYTEPLPSGIEYVVMAYNLHGGHSGPGPKADKEFIARLAEQCRQVTDKMPRLALASGGVLWESGGKVRMLTEDGVQALAKKMNATPIHEPGGAWSFSGRTQVKGGKGEDVAWFADGETLAGWQQAARDEGFEDFALWRLGGNDSLSLRRFMGLPAPSRYYRTLYVDQKAAKKGSGLAADTPFQTLAAALAAAKPGDRIQIAPGLYRERLNVKTPNLRILARDVVPGRQPTVTIAASKGPEPVLRDGTNSLWRGIAFQAGVETENLVELAGFRGRFEYCRFSSAAEKDGSQALLWAGKGSPAFHGCVFSDLGSQNSAVNFESAAGSKISMTYCLFTDLRCGALEFSGAGAANFTNCLFARCRNVLSRRADATGRASFVNSVFFLNEKSEIFCAQSKNLPPVQVQNCAYTPALNRFGGTNFAQMGFGSMSMVNAENSFMASPRFVSARGKAILNLGIDDAQNVEYFGQILREASLYNFPMTIAVNTGRMTPALWEEVKRQRLLGAEIACHTSSHVPLTLTEILKVSLYNPKLGAARLTIDKNRKLTITADGKVLFRYSLTGEDENKPSMGDLVASLRQLGLEADLTDIYFQDVPCRFLLPVENQDILFSDFKAALSLDRLAFMEYEITRSLKELEKNLGYRVRTLVYPFTSADGSAIDVAARRGFTAARAGGMAAYSHYNSTFHPLEIWAYGANRFQESPGTDPRLLREIALMVLDSFKDNGMIASIFSHGPNEMSLEDWNVFLAAVAEDGTVPVLTLQGMVDLVKAASWWLGISPENGGAYRLPEGKDLTDYHLTLSSPLLGAGVRTGASEDFEGKKITSGAVVNIGLYQ